MFVSTRSHHQFFRYDPLSLLILRQRHTAREASKHKGDCPGRIPEGFRRDCCLLSDPVSILVIQRFKIQRVEKESQYPKAEDMNARDLSVDVVKYQSTKRQDVTNLMHNLYVYVKEPLVYHELVLVNTYNKQPNNGHQ